MGIEASITTGFLHVSIFRRRHLSISNAMGWMAAAPAGSQVIDLMNEGSWYHHQLERWSIDEGQLPSDNDDRLIVVGALAFLREAAGGDSALPRCLDQRFAQARLTLTEEDWPTLAREEVLALLRYSWLTLEPEVTGVPLPWGVYLGARLRPDLALALLRAWSLEAADQADLLELYWEEAGINRGGIHPWIDPEMLETEGRQRARILNELRQLRLDGKIVDRWAMWSRLAAHQKEGQRAELVMSVGLPGFSRPDLSTLGHKVDVILDMDTFKDCRNAQQRRSLASRRISEALSRGKNVAWLANSSSLESRQSLVAAARGVGAVVTILLMDDDVMELGQKLEEGGWEISERTWRRGLEVLEGPRPHEADVLQIVQRGQVKGQYLSSFSGWEAVWQVDPE